MQIYHELEITTKASFLPLLLLKDPGFSLVNYLALQIGLPYEWFSAIFSGIIMVLFYKYFSCICCKSMIPLFFFYSTYFLIYPFSAIRQGITLAILLSFIYPLLRDGKYFKCGILILIASFFHLSLIISYLLIPIYKLKTSSKKLLLLISPFIFMLFFKINVFQLLPFPYIENRISSYVEDGMEISILAVIVRLVVLFLLFFISDRVYQKNEELRGIRNILVCGFIVYCIFSFDGLIASRLAIYFRIFEGLYLLLLLYQTGLRKINIQLVGCYVMIAFVLFVKDIGSFIDQGSYANCNIVTYPYLNVFDSDNTIMYYRKNLGMADRANF